MPEIGAPRHTVWIVLGRKKAAEPAVTVQDRVERAGAKNRPTPSRRQQEAARKRPLVPTDRKAAGKSNRQANRLARLTQRQAMLSGDEANLPLRDKGPAKRFIRDYVDARWNVGEFMLPVMVLVLVLTFLGNRFPWALMLVFVLVYGLVLAGVIDAFFMWRRLRARLVTRFGEEPPRGSAWYAVTRAFQMRHSRLPRPQVDPGATPSCPAGPGHEPSRQTRGRLGTRGQTVSASTAASNAHRCVATSSVV